MNENCPSLALWLRCFHLVAVDVAAFGHHLNQLSRIIAKLGDSYNYATKTALLNSCQFSVRLCNYVVVILVFERDDTPTVVCNFLKNYIISTVPVRSFEYILHVYSWIARGVSVGLVASSHCFYNVPQMSDETRATERYLYDNYSLKSPMKKEEKSSHVDTLTTKMHSILSVSPSRRQPLSKHH